LHRRFIRGTPVSASIGVHLRQNGVMRRLLPALALAFLMPAALPAQSGPNDKLARDVFKELIEINTTDTAAGNVTRAAEAMAARLTAAGFPAADVQLLGPDPKKHNLVARLRGKGTRRPILLLAHLDVVEARRDDWTTDPFTFLEKDGFFYGRGTTDDKSMAAQFVANIIRLKQEGFTSDRDLILALTADEEGGQFNGVDWLLQNHRNLIDAEFAINEGGGGTMRRGKYLTNEVQASEKVYQDFRLEVKNSGGHSSLPVKDNAIYHLSAGLTRLAAFEFPVALNEVTRTYFERSAAVESDPKIAADMRAMAGTSPDPAAAARLAAAQPYFNALMRTTCVATLVDAGHATNALPQMARANVNCRILPGVAPASVRDKLMEVLADPQISVALVGQANPSRPSPLRPDVMDAVETLTKQMFPGVIVIPTMSTGATDGLFLRNGEIPTYGVDGNFGDMEDVRAHGRDERIGVKQFFEGLEFQYRLIKALAAK
jgi:acetylornithine deacetylase/succinyl-diaminopimelate desuccinylase-like protein